MDSIKSQATVWYTKLYAGLWLANANKSVYFSTGFLVFLFDENGYTEMKLFSNLAFYLTDVTQNNSRCQFELVENWLSELEWTSINSV
jgi:hypothetical protein